MHYKPFRRAWDDPAVDIFYTSRTRINLRRTIRAIRHFFSKMRQNLLVKTLLKSNTLVRGKYSPTVPTFFYTDTSPPRPAAGPRRRRAERASKGEDQGGGRGRGQGESGGLPGVRGAPPAAGLRDRVDRGIACVSVGERGQGRGRGKRN